MAKNNNIKKKRGSGGKRLKQPSINNEVSPETQPPIFSLEHMQSDYSVIDCKADDQAQFAIRLRKLSQMTWAQIKGADRHGLGQEKIARKAIKPTIPPYITEDVDFLALRFSGMKPMVGYRIDRVFYILWLDKNFSVYDH